VNDYQRHIPFEGCFNFRDLGGYRAARGGRIRWRRPFRSTTPEWMTKRDVERARALHIELIIDLRGQDAPGSGPLDLPPTRHVAVGPSISPSSSSSGPRPPGCPEAGRRPQSRRGVRGSSARRNLRSAHPKAHYFVDTCPPAVHRTHSYKLVTRLRGGILEGVPALYVATARREVQ